MKPENAIQDPNTVFAKKLEEARKPTHSGMHPFTQAWIDGKLSRKQLGLWAIQHYYYIEPIAQQFAVLFSRLPDLDARTHMLENLLGEEDPKGRHPDLLLDFAQYCGVDREYAMTAELRGDILPTTRAMRSWIWELVSHRTLAEAAAGIMVGLEGQLPTLYPLYVDRLHQMGFDDSQLQFFHVHIEGDTEHAHVGLEIAERYSTTAELEEKAIGAVKASGQLRWAFLSGMYRAIVLNEEI